MPSGFSRWRSIRLLASLGLVLGVATLVQAQSLVAEPPRLELGATHASGVLQSTLVLRNTGDEPLRVYAVEPNCRDCTSVEFRATDLGAGEVAVVPVTMRSPGGREAHYAQRLRVRSSDRARPEFDVVVAGHFVPALAVERWHIDLGSVAAGADVEFEVQLTNWGERAIIHLAASSEDELEDNAAMAPVTVTAGTIQEPSTATGRIRLRMPVQTGPLRRQLELRTTNSRQPVLRLRVSASVEAHPLVEQAGCRSEDARLVVPGELARRLGWPGLLAGAPHLRGFTAFSNGSAEIDEVEGTDAAGAGTGVVVRVGTDAVE
jgi:hypothetical protein